MDGHWCRFQVGEHAPHVQVFLGLMTLELEVNGESDFDKSLRLYRQVRAALLACAGMDGKLAREQCIGMHWSFPRQAVSKNTLEFFGANRGLHSFC